MEQINLSGSIGQEMYKPRIIVLGVAQDGGYPQTGCQKKCCKEDFTEQKYATCLCLVIPNCYNGKIEKDVYFFDCTPDFKYQLNFLNDLEKKLNSETDINIKGIFLTHAHIGHYLGLVNFGRECMNTHNIPVYAMEKMSKFIQNNAPFSLLVNLNNIKINIIQNGEHIKLKYNESVSLSEKLLIIEPFEVKHRGEFSETCGYRIFSVNKSVIFIPDIDSWENEVESTNDGTINKNIDLDSLIKDNDYLFLDATFYSGEEISNRNVKDIPHPFIKDSIKVFDSIIGNDILIKSKINFIHLNHTNPCLNPKSEEFKHVIESGYKLAEQGNIITL